jgi:hypothetical protein
MRSQDQDQVMEEAEVEKADEESEQYHSVPEEQEPIIEQPEHHSESHSEVDAERHSEKLSASEIEEESEHAEEQ